MISHESYARQHGYDLVETRRGWRVLSPREQARCLVDAEGGRDDQYFANIYEAWREAARRINRALSSRRRRRDI